MSRKRSAVDNQLEAPVSKIFVDDSVSHFSRLPVEVLENIFIFLDLEDLKACLLVNKNCSKVISGSRKLMRRFFLHINGTNVGDKDVKEIVKLRRLYQKLRIHNMTANQIETNIAAIEEIGCRVLEVKIENCSTTASRQLLPCFPNVVKLEIKNFSGSVESLSPTKFPKLKHLKLQRADNVYITPEIWNLETLDLHCQRKTSDSLSKLLENQKSLDTLRLDVTDFSVRNLQLNLHPKLKIRTMFVDSSLISVQALHVIEQFGGKVDCLKYFGHDENDDLQPVLQSFNTVKALSLYKLPKYESSYHSATTNTELTELTIRYSINWRVLFGAFEIFPSLRKISIHANSLKIWVLTQEELSRLQENLNQLDRFTVEFGLQSNLKTLKQFADKITDLYLSLDFLRISKSIKVVCMNVDFVSIEGDQGSNMSLDSNKIINCFPNLKTLQLGSNVFDVFKPNLLEAIKDKAKNLKSLKLKNARKDLTRVLNQEARLLGIDELSITSIDGEFEFNRVNDFNFN